ncbi:MAG TPA: MarP family serine protease [Mycobacteriales bacterium]|nr:MarP family serine protease [Mycobacteriales bacterium]
MDLLDLLLLLACAGFALSGYRQGFIIGVLSFVGFFGGGVLGARYAATLHRWFGGHGRSAVFGLVVVFVAAAVGQVLATIVGDLLRRRLTWQPARQVDAMAGAGVSVLSVLLVGWFLGTALAHSALTGVARQIQHSRILTTIDGMMPDSAKTWDAAFRRLVQQNGFPQVFGAIGAERIVPVAPPDPRVAGSRAVQVAEPDIVKVTGVAPSCRRQLEGSGFLFAPQHVITNAHVVAGVRSPSVLTVAGRTYDARVVLYDPRRDVAVLFVPGLDTRPLSFAGVASAGQSAVVAGYPENGPFQAVAARIRTRQPAQGPDIYQDRQVTREIYAVYATVRPGNSGGPLLSPDGAVYGVVFAASVDDPHTGYALTAHEVAGDAAAGQAATQQVSTQGCD